jgi:hypothetical protein
MVNIVFKVRELADDRTQISSKFWETSMLTITTSVLLHPLPSLLSE